MLVCRMDIKPWFMWKLNYLFPLNTLLIVVVGGLKRRRLMPNVRDHSYLRNTCIYCVFLRVWVCVWVCGCGCVNVWNIYEYLYWHSKTTSVISLTKLCQINVWLNTLIQLQAQTCFTMTRLKKKWRYLSRKLYPSYCFQLSI